MKKFLLSILLVGAAHGAPLTLGEALARVDAGHPWLRDRAPLTALAASRAAVATAPPPAEISLQLENALGTGEFRAAKSLETTLQFSRALDWVDRRTARRTVATAQNETERLEWEERRRGLLAEAARRFVQVVAAQVLLANTHEQLALARRTVDATDARHAKAAASVGELARTRLALSQSELDAEHAEHLLQTTRQNLASLWGARASDFDHAVAELAPLPAVFTYEQLAAQLASAPAQARFAALSRWREAEEKLARSTGARGETRWVAGLRRNEATDDFGLVAGVSYEWPTQGLSGARATEARAERERTSADAEAALLDARAGLHALWQELNHARIEHDTTRDEMLPAAQAWIASVESGLAVGRFDVRELLEARTALFTARRRQIQSAADYHLTLVALEQLLGGPATL